MARCTNCRAPAAHDVHGDLFCAKCTHCSGCEECDGEVDTHPAVKLHDEDRVADDAADDACGWRRGRTAGFDEDAAHAGRGDDR
jgi:hypothetical protein